MRVDVYRNLHKQCFSVKECKSGLVVLHEPLVAVTDATFVVQPAGRERVRKERKKNVHAFVRGTLTKVDEAYPGPTPRTWHSITYNPYKFDQFVTRDEHVPVAFAEVVVLTLSGMTASGLTYA